MPAGIQGGSCCREENALWLALHTCQVGCTRVPLPLPVAHTCSAPCDSQEGEGRESRDGLRNGTLQSHGGEAHTPASRDRVMVTAACHISTKQCAAVSRHPAPTQLVLVSWSHRQEDEPCSDEHDHRHRRMCGTMFGPTSNMNHQWRPWLSPREEGCTDCQSRWIADHCSY